MKPGLRLSILLLLGGLMLVAFVPLFYATATYTSLWQERQQNALRLERESAAAAVARALARQLARDPSALSVLAQQTGLRAAGVFRSGATSPEATLGDAAALPAGKIGVSGLPGARRESSAPAPDQRLVRTAAGASMAVVASSAEHDAVVLIDVDRRPAVTDASPLIRLLGLYSFVVAVGSLVLAYFALTRLIVEPIAQLSAAAGRVAGGARRFEPPQARVAELSTLAHSFEVMTERLIGEEAALRSKIDEVELATRRLAEAQDRLVRSERLASVGRLAAGLAHEIGNPISALIGLQDLLIEGGLAPAEQRDFLQRMRKETERINRILRDLLQFARPAAKSGQAAPGPGDVETAIHDTAALLDPQQSLREITLELDVCPGLAPVALSREQLMQVLLNLVLNAADACGAGGTVRIRAREASGGVRIEVEDTGPGVAAPVVERLFEPFVTTKEVGKGTGLGLAVCRGLVESVGGTINLDRSYTAGARFVVELPGARGRELSGACP